MTLVLLCGLWYWSLHTASGAQWGWNRAVSATDGLLSGRFMSGTVTDGMIISEFGVQTETVSVTAVQVDIQLDLDLMPLTVVVPRATLTNLQVKTSASKSAEAEESLDLESVLGGMRLPVRIDAQDVSISTLSIVVGTAEPVIIDEVASAFFWHNSLLLHRLDVRQGENTAKLDGEAQLFQPITARFNLQAVYDEIDVDADIASDGRDVTLQNVSVRAAFLDATANATVRLREAFEIDAAIDVARFAPAALTEAWPSTHSVSGALDIAASADSVRVSAARFRIDGSDMQVALDGVFDRLGETVAGKLEWSDARWPIDAENPDIVSALGEIELSGNLDAWKIAGVTTVGTSTMPDGRFEIAGGGDRDGLALEILDSEVLGGSVAGDVAYSWADSGRFNLELQLESIETSALLPDWPGSISGGVTAAGTQTPLALKVALSDIDGRIQDLPLQANGAFSVSNDVLTASDLFIMHGDASVRLDGSADSPQGIGFDASIETIGRYVANVTGGLTANGRLSRVEPNPFLSLNLSSDEILVGGVQLTDIELSDRRADGNLAGFVLDIGSLASTEQWLNDIQAVASIATDAQSLRLSGISHGSEIVVELAGAFADWRSPMTSEWSGQVVDFSIDLEDEHSLTLKAPAPLMLSSTLMSIADFCLADRAAASICANASRDDQGSTRLDARLEAVPLELLEHVGDTGLTFDQTLSGQLRWEASRDEIVAGVGDLSLSAGRVASLDDPELVLETGDGEIDFAIKDGKLLSGQIAIPLASVGGVKGDFRVLDIGTGTDSGVQANVDVAISDISLLAHFSPLLSSMKGGIDAKLTLSGTLVEPLLQGRAELMRGALTYRPIGLHFEELNAVANLNADRSIDLSGNFRAGDGYGEIVSSANYSDVEETGIRFKIKGDNLQVVNIEDIQLVAKPDFEVTYRERTLTINGEILIPSARIAPKNLAEGRVNESEDVTVIGDVSDEDKDAVAESKFNFRGDLKVALGDNVIIVLDVAKASLTGSSILRWRGDAMPMVDGRYNLAGSIQAFGQVLNIAEGGVRFANVPASEPYLRIRAEREIFGNSQVKRAGVLVEGVAKRPSISAYTFPMTTEERALTLLVTGSDFDYEQGVGAVGFGTYIAPKLFISYGVGVFDRENIISARYDLARGFGIKATSGDKESGVDISYKVEN